MHEVIFKRTWQGIGCRFKHVILGSDLVSWHLTDTGFTDPISHTVSNKTWIPYILCCFIKPTVQKTIWRWDMQTNELSMNKSYRIKGSTGQYSYTHQLKTQPSVFFHKLWKSNTSLGLKSPVHLVFNPHPPLSPKAMFHSSSSEIPSLLHGFHLTLNPAAFSSISRKKKRERKKACQCSNRGTEAGHFYFKCIFWLKTEAKLGT